MRVLVAEDDPPARRMLVYQLRLWGHDPVPVTDGGEARAGLEADDAPGLVLLEPFERDAVRRREGLLPICAWCKRIDDRAARWQDLEGYVASQTPLTHTNCPDCRTRQQTALDCMRRRTDRCQ